MITPVSEEDLKLMESVMRAYVGDIGPRVIAELRALRVVADAAVRSVDEVGNLELESALRDAGRLP